MTDPDDGREDPFGDVNPFDMLSGLGGLGVDPIRAVESVLGGGIRAKVDLLNSAMDGVLRLVSEAYRKDATRTEQILEGDESGLAKVAGLCDLVLDSGIVPDDDDAADGTDIDIQ